LENREGAEALLKGVLRLLNDRLLPDGVQVDKVDSDGLWVIQGGVKLPLWDMSDGYRTVIALILDLSYQLHTAYQGFELEQQGNRVCVPYPGVVLIDEIELHLHLSWQRRIGFWLKEHFPNIQFIVTTHSPFVCQAADPKGLIRLPAPGENRTAEHVSDELYKTVVNGTVDEAALTELFGLEHVHSDESERLRERVAELEARVLEGEATSAEREELDRLSAQLPNTGSAIVDRAVRKLGLDK
jgi:predicted ATP-binding protein involved in virulence